MIWLDLIKILNEDNFPKDSEFEDYFDIHPYSTLESIVNLRDFASLYYTVQSNAGTDVTVVRNLFDQEIKKILAK